MLKPWLKSFKNIFKNNGTDKFLKKSQNHRALLELLSLEERLNLSTVFVSYDVTSGILTLDSKNDALGANSSYAAFQSTGSEDNILNFNATVGNSETFFQSVSPLVFVTPLSSGSQSVQVDTRNLAGFSKIVFQGSEGNNNLVLGSIDGNVIGDTASANFDFEVDVLSFLGGSSGGIDSLQINGIINLKGNGAFTTDSKSTSLLNANLESLNFGSSASILSIGSGDVRLVADGDQSSNIVMDLGSFIDIGSGSVYLRSGDTGNIFLNGNAITTIGGSVDLATNVVLQSSTSISTGLGDSSSNIDFRRNIQGVIGSGQDLNLDTTGTITISGDAGNINLPLGAIRVKSDGSNGVSIQDLYAKSLNSLTFGAFQSNGVINLNYIDGLSITTTDASLGTVTLGSSLLKGSSIITSGNGILSLNNAGLLQIYGGLSLDGAFSQSGPGLVSLGSSSNNIFSITTTSDAISFNSPITFHQAQNFSSNSSGVLGEGSNISFDSTVDGFFPLTLVAGTGNITFSNKIGSTTPLSSILVSNVNKFNAVRSINAESLTITVANNSVSFSKVQGDFDVYTNKTGLSISTSGTAQSQVNFYNPVKCLNDAIININSLGFLNLYSGANLSVETGSMVLGGSAGGGINLYSNISSTSSVGTGSITFANPVTLLADVTVSTTDGSVLFANTINSNPSATLRSLTLDDTLNQGNFSFAKSVGLTSPLNVITVKSSAGVLFASTVIANSIIIEDSKNTIDFKGNLTLSGSLQTQVGVGADIYNLTLSGPINQIGGSGIFANTGLITLGNSNSSTFLFNGGISESGGGGVVAQGSFVTSGAVSFASNFKVNGNNVGIVTLDLGSDSIFNGLVDVQASERINKNGIGTLRLITNTGSIFKGTMVVNQGTAIFSDNFSSMDKLTISGGTVSGAGSVGNVYGLAGTVDPGDSVGTLTTGNFSLNALMTLSLKVGTTSNGVNDKVLVNGTVSLNNATLSVTTGNFITLGTTYTIIQNDGTDVVSGTFINLPEGSSYTSGNITFTVSYKGGSGNDVTLKVINIITILPPTPVNVPGIKQTFATGIDAGGGPLVTVNYADGHTSSFFAYDQNFRGGVRVAMGDINGDGNVDLITAPGVGGGPNIKIFNLVSGTPIQVADFFVFEAAFFGGLYIAVGNLNNDGFGDIIVGAGPGGGPRVSAYAGSQNFSINGNTVMTTFFAYAPEFAGGITVAAADRTGDGLDEIVTGAGFGGGPNVTVFQLQQTPQGAFNPIVFQNFFAFDPLFTGGIYVAGGSFTTNSSNYDDIFVGTGPGTKATVAVAFGTGGFYYLNPFGNFTGGVRVGISSSTIKGSTPNYLMAAAGPGGGPQVNLYDTNFAEVDRFFASNPTVTLGVFANSTIL